MLNNDKRIRKLQRQNRRELEKRLLRADKDKQAHDTHNEHLAGAENDLARLRVLRANFEKSAGAQSSSDELKGILSEQIRQVDIEIVKATTLLDTIKATGIGRETKHAERQTEKQAKTEIKNLQKEQQEVERRRRNESKYLLEQRESELKAQTKVTRSAQRTLEKQSREEQKHDSKLREKQANNSIQDTDAAWDTWLDEVDKGALGPSTAFNVTRSGGEGETEEASSETGVPFVELGTDTPDHSGFLLTDVDTGLLAVSDEDLYEHAANSAPLPASDSNYDPSTDLVYIELAKQIEQKTLDALGIKNKTLQADGESTHLSEGTKETAKQSRAQLRRERKLAKQQAREAEAKAKEDAERAKREAKQQARATAKSEIADEITRRRAENEIAVKDEQVAKQQARALESAQKQKAKEDAERAKREAKLEAERIAKEKREAEQAIENEKKAAKRLEKSLNAERRTLERAVRKEQRRARQVAKRETRKLRKEEKTNGRLLKNKEKIYRKNVRIALRKKERETVALKRLEVKADKATANYAIAEARNNELRVTVETLIETSINTSTIPVTEVTSEREFEKQQKAELSLFEQRQTQIAEEALKRISEGNVEPLEVSDEPQSAAYQAIVDKELRVRADRDAAEKALLEARRQLAVEKQRVAAEKSKADHLLAEAESLKKNQTAKEALAAQVASGTSSRSAKNELRRIEKQKEAAERQAARDELEATRIIEKLNSNLNSAENALVAIQDEKRKESLWALELAEEQVRAKLFSDSQALRVAEHKTKTQQALEYEERLTLAAKAAKEVAETQRILDADKSGLDQKRVAKEASIALAEAKRKAKEDSDRVMRALEDEQQKVRQDLEARRLVIQEEAAAIARRNADIANIKLEQDLAERKDALERTRAEQTAAKLETERIAKETREAEAKAKEDAERAKREAKLEAERIAKETREAEAKAKESEKEIERLKAQTAKEDAKKAKEDAKKAKRAKRESKNGKNLQQDNSNAGDLSDAITPTIVVSPENTVTTLKTSEDVVAVSEATVTTLKTSEDVSTISEAAIVGVESKEISTSAVNLDASSAVTVEVEALEVVAGIANVEATDQTGSGAGGTYDDKPQVEDNSDNANNANNDDNLNSASAKQEEEEDNLRETPIYDTVEEFIESLVAPLELADQGLVREWLGSLERSVLEKLSPLDVTKASLVLNGRKVVDDDSVERYAYDLEALALEVRERPSTVVKFAQTVYADYVKETEASVEGKETETETETETEIVKSAKQLRKDEKRNKKLEKAKLKLEAATKSAESAEVPKTAKQKKEASVLVEFETKSGLPALHAFKEKRSIRKATREASKEVRLAARDTERESKQSEKLQARITESRTWTPAGKSKKQENQQEQQEQPQSFVVDAGSDIAQTPEIIISETSKESTKTKIKKTNDKQELKARKKQEAQDRAEAVKVAKIRALEDKSETKMRIAREQELVSGEIGTTKERAKEVKRLEKEDAALAAAAAKERAVQDKRDMQAAKEAAKRRRKENAREDIERKAQEARDRVIDRESGKINKRASRMDGGENGPAPVSDGGGYSWETESGERGILNYSSEIDPLNFDIPEGLPARTR
jgi:hypothetical protein